METQFVPARVSATIPAKRLAFMTAHWRPLALVFLLVPSCAHRARADAETSAVTSKAAPAQNVKPSSEARPEWTTHACGGAALSDMRGPAFVAFSGGYAHANAALRKNGAQNRARTEAVKLFQEFFASAYLICGPGTCWSEAELSEEQSFGPRIQQVVLDTVASITVEEVWDDETAATAYAVARLPLAAYVDVLQHKAEALTARERETLSRDAEQAFARMVATGTARPQ